MPEHERRMRFAPDAQSPRHARRMLRHAFLQAGLDEADELAETALLLASELFENAVLHAGTDFEVALTLTPDALRIAVTDRGAGPLEVHLTKPRQRYGRAVDHGRGLLMVQQLADEWGTRHRADGSHEIWFVLNRLAKAAPAPAPRPPEWADPMFAAPSWSDAERVQRLLHVPASLGDRLDAQALVSELVRRLREILDADGVAVEVDHGDGRGAHRLSQDGLDPTDVPRARVVHLRLPLTAPLRGHLLLVPRQGTQPAEQIAELAAHRIALAVESDWLRGADRRRRAWMAYLADTSELLGQSRDVELTVAVVPQVLVPRLGQWCAVHLADATGRPQLAALTHADENAIPELRTALDPGAALPAPLRAQMTALLDGSTAPAWFGVPSDGVAIALTAGGRPLGVLAVGRPVDRPHSPEDFALISDIARRAALAIDNAQRTELHIQTSQALQHALLPRALPTATGIEFAAEYLPLSTGSDVGGDFYDVLAIAPGRWLAAIGDVCGKGARAAARTGLVRDVLRVLVKDGRTLPHAIDRLNEVMMEAADPSQFCTLAAAMISRATDGLSVDLVLAGHLQPALIRADGTSEFVGRHGTALGLVDRVELVCTTHRLGAGDVLLAYTDGITERRRGRDLFGSDRLLAAAADAAGGSAADVVASVRAAVETFSGQERSDDIALLAVRAGTGGSTAG